MDPSRRTRIALVVACTVAAAFAFYATQSNPYNYYVATRWIVFLTCGFGVWVWRDRMGEGMIVPLFILTGLIFNPILPFYFKRSTWFWIDIGAGISLLGCGVATLRRRH